MPSPLIVRRRPKPAPRLRAALDAFQKSVERQIEIQSRLLAIGDHIQTGIDLIVNCRRDCIVLCLRDIVWTQFIQVLGRELKPARERIASDNRRPQRAFLHQYLTRTHFFDRIDR